MIAWFTFDHHMHVCTCTSSSCSHGLCDPHSHHLTWIISAHLHELYQSMSHTSGWHAPDWCTFNQHASGSCTLMWGSAFSAHHPSHRIQKICAARPSFDLGRRAKTSRGLWCDRMSYYVHSFPFQRFQELCWSMWRAQAVVELLTLILPTHRMRGGGCEAF